MSGRCRKNLPLYDQDFTKPNMDRDDANREILRLIEHHRALPFADLLALADQPTVESEVAAPQGITTFTVDVRRSSDDAVRIDVSAFGNNWWKLERIDESIIVTRSDSADG